ncbi:MAG: GIY-YIG nuclease family protein [Fibrobacter sp.]|nr:GIY-YIG nuclease family protein [Fibrobacter sp.]
MYILECDNGKFYTGSTKDLERRMIEHASGAGAKFTKKYKPVKLVYLEEYQRIDQAFYREKQLQRWSHQKKKALVTGDVQRLCELAECRERRRAAPRLGSGTDSRDVQGSGTDSRDVQGSGTDSRDVQGSGADSMNTQSSGAGDMDLKGTIFTSASNIPSDAEIIKKRINDLFKMYNAVK